MCSNITVHKKKATIKDKTVGDPFSSTHPTAVDFLIYYNNIFNKETCNTLIGVRELAAILHHTPSTIRFYNSQKPHKIPPRLASRDDLVWKISTVFLWLNCAGETTLSLPALVLDKPKPTRGRPTRAAIAAREAAAAARLAGTGERVHG